MDNYTWDGHIRPLSYAIAPGTYVYDVSDAIPPSRKRTVRIAPYSAQGTEFDFKPGDEIEQAIGPDPFKPQAFRVWMSEDVPGAWPSAVFDIANYGTTSRYSAMSIGGGPSTLEAVQRRQEKKPASDNIITVKSASTVGINFLADRADSALLFHQPSADQKLKWYHAQEEGKAPKEAELGVSRTTGALTLTGNGLSIKGGISATDTPTRNLRGLNIPVQAGATTLTVNFPEPELDDQYATFVELSWLTNRSITGKTPEGFTVTFENRAPEGARPDWLLVR